MLLWTWAEIREKVQADLDLEGEENVTIPEMLGYANEAIDECEATIHNLNEDYFFTKDKITLVPGTASYVMPADIYASKIRGLFFDDGTTRYPIRRIRKELLFNIGDVQSTDDYQYLELNRLNDGVVTEYGPRIELFPTSRHAGALVDCYYIRNARRLAVDADECDVTEFVAFVINFIKVQCAVKEMHPQLQFYQGELERTRELMVVTLTEKTPDSDNAILGDFSHYIEHN